ncbi:MAG: hypothetical protein GXY36_05565 [Chloroflexi bacterium]|nr:hypothetical protein [Chloroflexota bacterium]
MDGIFGVGLAEMVIIALALFIIGGPENTTKWARELGRQVRKLRQAWEQMVAEMEQELGPDGKEILDATRELSQSTRELRSIASPKRLMSDAARMVDSTLNEAQNPKIEPPEAAPAAEQPGSSNSNGTEQKYQAWLPPKKE